MDRHVLQVIDYSKVSTTDDSISHSGFKEQLGSALMQDGIVYLINHGIPQATIAAFFEKSKAFYQLPAKVKESVRKRDPYEVFGFVPSGTERATESETPLKVIGITKREAFDFTSDQANLSPSTDYSDQLRDWIPVAEKITNQLKILATSILKATDVFFAADSQSFLNFHKSLTSLEQESVTHVRSTYYFPLETQVLPEKPHFRLQSHLDWGSFTLLFQDGQSGLECQLGDGTWVTVEPVPETVILQVGQTLEVMSGGNLPAVPHRVRLTEANSRTGRQSIAFFVHPDNDSRVVPIVAPKANWTTPFGPESDNLTHAQLITRRRQRTIVYE